jgi:hypothetical protein
MKAQTIKLNRHGYDRAIQHNRQVKKTTRWAGRRFRHQGKAAIRLGQEPGITASGGERF